MKKLIFGTIMLLFFSKNYAQAASSDASLLTNTSTTPNLTAAAIDPPPPPPNAISFSYDAAGNQTKRMFIYITPPLPRMNNNPIIPSSPEAIEAKLLPSDLYEEISYYPNPVKSELYLKWTEIDSNDMQTIELFDMNGRMLRSYTNQSDVDSATIDFESYPAGYYTLQLYYNTEEPKSLKIVKQ